MTGVMASTSGSWMLVAGATALFGALFLAIAAVTLPGVRRRRLAKELARDTEVSTRSQMSALGKMATELAEKGLARHDHANLVASALERAGLDMRAAEYVLVVAASSLGAAAVGGLLGGVVVALVAVGITVGSFAAVLSIKATRRCRQFDEQLPDSLALIASGLRAGHSLPQAIDSLAREAEAPTCDEFRRALFETQLGHPLPTALRALATRVRSEDFNWVVQAIEIQGEVGGDLAAVLDNVTGTIRDRTRVRRQIDTLTAEGRLSGMVLFALPILMFAFMIVVNPKYIGELTSTFAGTLMLITGGTLMGVGAVWLRRITRLAY